MANKVDLKNQLREKEAQLEEVVHQIAAVNLKISKLSHKFFNEDGRVQQRLNRVQASRPRGNPANQWPHRPITDNLRAFYQSKENKERQLWQKKDLLRQVFDHNRAILVSQRLALTNSEHDIQSQIRLLRIQIK